MSDTTTNLKNGPVRWTSRSGSARADLRSGVDIIEKRDELLLLADVPG